ncbi:hypothetical protein EW145_g4699 [Phellinidium pouzarii]|uniref:Uncharacterized protein n=1 Tax=Phellinidium pouzarii TaxID=167371 RepID=A0A4S4L340_9AGAM|nr:hypothetical protein EW145_g4699 [Phellinidium pouzarii]
MSIGIDIIMASLPARRLRTDFSTASEDTLQAFSDSRLLGLSSEWKSGAATSKPTRFDDEDISPSVYTL